jgi:hypothetical protein
MGFLLLLASPAKHSQQALGSMLVADHQPKAQLHRGTPANPDKAPKVLFWIEQGQLRVAQTVL